VDVVYVILGALMVVVGIALILAEIGHPGVFLLVPAGILIVAGFFLVFAPHLFDTSPIAAALALVGVGFVGAVISMLIYTRIAPRHAPIPSTMETLRGQVAQVVVEIVPGTMKGKVRVRGELWSATSERPIPSGRSVVILGGEGVTLRVAEAPGEEAAASLSPEPQAGTSNP